MDINKLMDMPETNRDRYIRLKNVLEKNKAAVEEKELKEGGKYYKSYNKLCDDVLTAARGWFKDFVLEGFPYNEKTQPIVRDIWKSLKDVVKYLAIECNDLSQLELCLTKVQKLYEDRANVALGTNLHYERVPGINMPILISDK